MLEQKLEPDEMLNKFNAWQDGQDPPPRELGFECTDEYQVVISLNLSSKGHEIRVSPYIVSNIIIRKQNPSFLLSNNFEFMIVIRNC